MIRIFTAFALLSLYNLTFSQEKIVRRPSCQDTLVVQSDDEGNVYLQWQLGTSTRLQTVSAMTGYHANILTSLNPILHFRDAEPCDLILIPFDPKRLSTYSISATYTVYYKVKSGETIFGIARRMLQIPVEELLQLNALDDYNLKFGQVLIVGYLSSDHSSGRQSHLPLAQYRMDEHGPVPDTQVINISPGRHFATQKGVAWWNKTKTDPNLFALHRSAPVNSLIEIRNPMFRRSVWAKVIGTIPVTYSDDISVIVSQGVARSLGAIDGRFYVEMSYEIR
jgi:hypothetical protein